MQSMHRVAHRLLPAVRLGIAVASPPPDGVPDGLLAEIVSNLVLGTLYPHILPLSTAGNIRIFGSFSQTFAHLFPKTPPMNPANSPLPRSWWDWAKNRIFHRFCEEKPGKMANLKRFFQQLSQYLPNLGEKTRFFREWKKFVQPAEMSTQNRLKTQSFSLENRKKRPNSGKSEE